MYAKAGEIDLSDALWGELAADSNVIPGLRTLNWRLLTVKNSKVWKTESERLVRARAIWNLLRYYDFTPDKVSYNTYISCFNKADDLEIAKEGDAVFHEQLASRGDRERCVSLISLNAVLKMWRNFAISTQNVSCREEALRSVLTILKEIYNLCSSGELDIQPTSVTVALVASLLDANNIEDAKRVGVLRLLDRTRNP